MIRQSFILLTGLALTAAAQAEEPNADIVVQAGVVSMGADAFDTFAGNDAMPRFGLRAGVGVHDRIDLVAGIETGQRGQSVRDVNTSAELFRAAYTASTLTLGAKADVRAADVVYPYVMAGLIGHMGHVRFDDDPTRRDHPGQVRSTAFSPGATAVAGLEMWLRPPDKDVIPVLQLELGWQGVLQHRHTDDMLPLGYSGVVFRSGLGVAF